MVTTALALIGLFALRVGLPLALTLALSEALRRTAAAR